MNDKIYVPEYTPQKYPCVTYSQSYIRAYKTQPRRNSVIDRDTFYFNNHYDRVSDTQIFGNYDISLVCLPEAQLTDNYFYRHDIDNILIVFIIISLVTIYFPFRLFLKLFKKGGF